MSLLAQVNQPNANRFYFALDTSPTDPTVTAPAFEATGTATSNGSFSALGTAVPGGIGMFNMETTLGRAQWAIGMDGVPAGANSGDNFALFAYDDNGAFLSAPLQVIRATGGVIASVGITTPTLVASSSVSAPNIIAAGAARTASASFVPEALPQVNPSITLMTLDAATMPGLAALIANPAINVIQLFSQFGVETTAGQPKMNLGLTFQANGGGALLTNGTICLGPGVPVTPVPPECPYTLYANLVRGVHFTNTTTSIAIGTTADTTPFGAELHFLNNDDNAGTPTSPSIIVSALGLM